MAITLTNTFGASLEIKESLQLEYAVNKLGDIANRDGVKSNSFDLPLTSEAKAFFDFPENFGTYKAGQYKINCNLFEKGVQISRGFCQVENIDYTKNTVSVSYFGNNVEWFEIAKNLYLDEMDFSELNHTYNRTNIFNSWLFDWENGYTYPFIDYGRFTDATLFNAGGGIYYAQTTLTDWFPAVFIRYIIQKFSQYGFAFEGAVLDLPFITELILPYSLKERPSGYDKTTIQQVSIGRVFRDTRQVLATIKSVVNTGVFQLFTFPVVPNFTVDEWNFTNSEYTASLEGFYQLSFYIQGQGGGSPYSGQLEIRVNGVAVATNTGINNFTLVSLNITLEVGDVVTFWINPTANSTNSFAVDVILQSGGLLPNQLFDFSNTLPHITFATLMKELALRFNLIFQVDDFAKRIKVFTFDELYKKISISIDWTDKIANKGELRFQDFVKDYAKTNRFVLTEANDDSIDAYNRLNTLPFGEGFFEINNDFLEAEKDLFTSKFAPTFMGRAYQNSVYIPTITIWDGTEYKLDPKLRLLYVDSNSSVLVFSWFIYNNLPISFSAADISIDGASSFDPPRFAYYYFIDSISNSPPTETLLFNDLFGGFDRVGTPLIERFYTQLEGVLNNNKFLEVPLLLTEVDFQNLDYSIPIYLGHPYFSYFFISKIDKDADKAVCRVELIKIA